MALKRERKSIDDIRKFMKAWDEKQSSSKVIRLSPPQKKFLEWFDEYQNDYLISPKNFDRINNGSEIEVSKSELKKVIPEIIEHEKYLSSFRTILNNIREIYADTYKRKDKL